MQTDVLIVGQGISGTMLSWWLQKEGKSFLVIDDNAVNASSKVAAGIMNPVTGRRYSITWMAEQLFPFAKEAYTQMGQALLKVFLTERNVIDFFPSPDSRNAFLNHLTENDTYLRTYPDQNRFNDWFRYDFGCGEIAPAYTVSLPLLLAAWREKLKMQNALLEERFAAEEVQIKEDGIHYRNITAGKLIFCDGVACANNPWFSLLPWSANKGEALLIECKGLPTDHVFKRGMLLSPTTDPDVFWAGSNYQRQFEDDSPSEHFRTQMTEQLKAWLKVPFTVLDHKAAVRPATVDRRPFLGFHPLFPSIGILNGMGTKGTSLAPYFANELVRHMVHQQPITPQADVRRFTRILSK